LAAFGGFLLVRDETAQRISLLILLGLEALRVFGPVNLKDEFPAVSIYGVADVRTRYSRAIPASILAALELIAQRLGNLEIGQQLGLSHKTVGRHRERTMNRLDLHSRPELVKFAIRTRLMSLE
jgi:DNA-binding CsgD family transcriptional regulator